MDGEHKIDTGLKTSPEIPRQLGGVEPHTINFKGVEPHTINFIVEGSEVLRIWRALDGILHVGISGELEEAARGFWGCVLGLAEEYGAVLTYTGAESTRLGGGPPGA